MSVIILVALITLLIFICTNFIILCRIFHLLDHNFCFVNFVFIFILCYVKWIWQEIDFPHPIVTVGQGKVCNQEWRILQEEIPILLCIMVHIYFYFTWFLFNELFLLFQFYTFNNVHTFHFFVALLDNDYYYGGSMRDLNNGHGRPRKSSSVSHLGEFIALPNN